MSAYSVTVAARSLIPSVPERLLVPTPREVATLAEARMWLKMNRATWIGALLPTEGGFVGLVVDDDGEPARTYDYDRDPDVAPIVHGRQTLREMRAAR